MSLSFTDQQGEALRTFAEYISGSETPINGLSARIIGIEDLATPGKAEALLNSLHSEDWQAASTHQAIAGTNDLLLAILLRIEGNVALHYWVAMRSPFELLDSSEIVAYGKTHSPFPDDLPLEKVMDFGRNKRK